MQGIGNDFVIIDTLAKQDLPPDLASAARTVCDRRLGVGADGLVLLQKGETAPFEMRMLNPDGSESETCGNAIRCIFRLARDRGYTSDDSFDVETGAGNLSLSAAGGDRVRVNMGTPKLLRGEIPMTGEPEGTFLDQPVSEFKGTAVSLGNPHLVLFVDDVAKVDLEHWGPLLETNSMFPNRINVHFVQVIDSGHLVQRTWERGAGVTMACGTGACASAVAAFLTGRAGRDVDIKLPGGHLRIEYAESGEVFMTGPAEYVFDGEIELS